MLPAYLPTSHLPSQNSPDGDKPRLLVCSCHKSDCLLEVNGFLEKSDVS